MTEAPAGPAGLWKNLALSLAAVVASIAAVDLFTFFALDWKPPGYGQEEFFQYSFLTGFAHVPNLDGTYYRYEHGVSYHIRTNRYGFADAERSLEKERPRIALLGDSTTQGWEADEPDRPQVVLEQLLGGRFEVLNFGMRAFGTDQTLLLFQQVGVHFAPDIVVYTFCINDLADNARSLRKPRFVLDPAAPGGLRLDGVPVAAQPEQKNPYYYWLDLAKHSFVFRQIYQLVHERYGAPAALADHFELRPYKRHYDADDTRRMQLTLALLGELERFLRERGMRLLLVEGIYRFAYDDAARARVSGIYGDVFDFERPGRELGEWAAARGVPFVSLPRSLRDEGVPIETIMNADDNQHLNAAGLRRFAQTLKEALMAQRWLAAGGDRA